MIASIPSQDWLTGPRPRSIEPVRAALRSLALPVRVVAWVAAATGGVFAALVMSSGDLNAIPAAILVFGMMTGPALWWVRSKKHPYRQVLIHGDVCPVRDWRASLPGDTFTTHTLHFDVQDESRVGSTSVPGDGQAFGAPRHVLATPDQPALAFIVYEDGTLLPATCLTGEAAAPPRRTFRVAVGVLLGILYLVVFFALAG